MEPKKNIARAAQEHRTAEVLIRQLNNLHTMDSADFELIARLG